MTLAGDNTHARACARTHMIVNIIIISGFLDILGLLHRWESHSLRDGLFSAITLNSIVICVCVNRVEY